jgi:predicted Abi (CAAX) family protease
MTDGVHERRRSIDVRSVASRVRRALALVRSRRDGRLAFAGATVAYFLVYLVAAGDLAFRTGLGAQVVLADDPLGKLLVRTGPASFEPIALVDGYVFRALLAPGDLVLGVGLAALVGANLAVTYLAVVQPKACGIEAGTGVVAAVPALLSGTACCGPVVLLAVGVTASGALVSLFAWLVPIGVLSLLASLAYVSGKLAI